MAILPPEVQAVADLGYAVVPASANKVPLVPWRRWSHERQTQADRDDLPRGDLYAVLTGSLYDLVILDFDGEAGLAEYMRRKLTSNVITGSGGRHVWLHSPGYPVKTVSAVAPGVDVRGEGGLAYFYGTSRKGTYRLQTTTFLNEGPNRPPIINLLPEKKAPEGGAPAAEWKGEGHGTDAALRILKAGVAEIAGAVEGSRNKAMCHAAYTAGGLVGAGVLDVEAAFNALVSAAAQCGAEDAVRVIAHQIEAGMAAPLDPTPRPDARGIVWVPATDPLPPRAETNAAAGNGAGGKPDTSPPWSPPWAKGRLPVPYDALPPAVAAYTRDGWKIAASPPEFLVASMLTVLGAGIGGLVTLGLREGWRIPPSMYVGLVGEPGTAKSPALRRALAPVRKVERDQEWANADTLARYTVDDVTTEKLALLLKANERGLLQAVDELKGFFGGMGQYKGDKGGAAIGRDRQFYLSAWDGNTIVVDRMKRASLLIPDPTLSVLGGIQPAVFDNLTNGEPDGMMERFLFVWGDPVREEWQEDDIDPTIRAAYSGLWHQCRDFGMQEVVVALTPEGRRGWKSWHDSFYRQTPPPTLASMWDKVKTHTARLALIYAVTDGASTCDASHIDRAAATTDWFLSHGAHVLSIAASFSPEERRHVKARDRLAKWLDAYTLQHGELPSGSQVLQFGPPGSRRARERDALLAEIGIVLP
jgi:hypothetical protein